MKVSEMEGCELDCCVAKARGWRDAHVRDGVCFAWPASSIPFQPSTNWCHGGPIIERENICLNRGDGSYTGDKKWEAHIGDTSLRAKEITGPTALIAAMRCFVASKYGDICPDQE
jgi:uncharacterized protein DUF2591